MRFICVAALSAIILLLAASKIMAQEVTVPFSSGFIGTIGQNTGQAMNILTFDALGVTEATFSQVSSNGLFGGTQGNDLDGTLRLYLEDGGVIAVPGAMNWRITGQGLTYFFGFIPDPLNVPQIFSYPGGMYVLDQTSNYGLLLIGRNYTFSSGDNLRGNAAKPNIAQDMNSYNDEINGDAPTITGPSGNPGAETDEISVQEGSIEVTTMRSDEPATWSLDAGGDSALFTINPDTGHLTFNSAPSFDAPSDSNRDNVYLVTIRATDTDGYFSKMILEVTVVPAPEVTTDKSVFIAADPGPEFDCAADPAQPEAAFYAPGTCVTYTISVMSADNGSLPIEDLHVGDTLPAGLRYVSTLSVNGFDAVTESGNLVEGVISVLSPGDSASFSFRALVE